MSTHVPHSGDERLDDPNGVDPILFDDCERCEEHADDPFLALDPYFVRALWNKMVLVEKLGKGHYRSRNERNACAAYYRVAVWMERNGALDRSWALFDA